MRELTAVPWLLPAGATATLCAMGMSEELAEGLQSFGKVYAWLKRELVDREEESRLALTCLVAKQHLFLLGPPGTGKSYLARLVGRTIGGDARFFELLLTRFTDPSEVFGPVSVKELVAADKYERKTSGYLPTAECAFLDEVWKASSAILNSLLTIVNERVYDNGGKREPVPLKTLFAASNELPQDEALEALYDRFLVRREVRPVRDPLLLLDRQEPREAPSLKNLSVVQDACRRVVLPDDVKAAMRDVKNRLMVEERIEVGDRRFQQSASLVRAAAVLDNGRQEAEPKDLIVLTHSWWKTPDQYMTVSRVVSEEIGKVMRARSAPEPEPEPAPAPVPAAATPRRPLPPRPPAATAAAGTTPGPGIPGGLRPAVSPSQIRVPQAPSNGISQGQPGARPWVNVGAPHAPAGPVASSGMAGGVGHTTPTPSPVPNLGGAWGQTVYAIVQRQAQQLYGDAPAHQAIHDALQAPEARDPANKHLVDRLAKLKGTLLNHMKWLGPTW